MTETERKEIQRRRVAVRLLAIIMAEQNGSEDIDELCKSYEHAGVGGVWFELADHVMNAYRELVWSRPGFSRHNDPLHCPPERKRSNDEKRMELEAEDKQRLKRIARRIFAVMMSEHRRSSIDAEHGKTRNKAVNERWLSVAKTAHDAWIDDLRGIAAPIIKKYQPKPN